MSVVVHTFHFLLLATESRIDGRMNLENRNRYQPNKKNQLSSNRAYPSLSLFYMYHYIKIWSGIYLHSYA